MPDHRCTSAWYLTGFLLLSLFPGCSLVPTTPETLPGYSREALAQVRQQSADLKQLQQYPQPSPTQQQQIARLEKELQQFERDVIRAAGALQVQNDWHGAMQLLKGAARLRPHSQSLSSAQQQLRERRQLHEERVRMEMAIHQGEQLLKDAQAYQRLQQLQGPGVLNWLELKNFDRKRNASAQSLLEFSQRALEREEKTDDQLVQRALKVARGLYGEELLLPQNEHLRNEIEQELAAVNNRLRPPQPRRTPQPRKKIERLPIAELQQALASGDLVSAQQHIDRLQQKAPQHPQLTPLKSQFNMQLNARVDTALKTGNDLYSQGHIEEALTVWREAEAIAPENVELRANIARAQKLLENLRALSAPFGKKH
ncbi:tetratricopeptide repeat protein [Microbulbifer sp. HZ11]|uniref:tetratricopeptide repeat protein n=1 Tax=unclassified Microbulbifer TaxID=2619833 RepID=UPI0005BADABC|nr:tetratricopeptide repeat protein [Microbulbifer sp. HZ11]